MSNAFEVEGTGGKAKVESLTKHLWETDEQRYNEIKMQAWGELVQQKQIPEKWTTFEHFTRVSFHFTDSKDEQRDSVKELIQFVDEHNEKFGTDIHIEHN